MFSECKRFGVCACATVFSVSMDIMYRKLGKTIIFHRYKWKKKKKNVAKWEQYLPHIRLIVRPSVCLSVSLLQYEYIYRLLEKFLHRGDRLLWDFVCFSLRSNCMRSILFFLFHKISISGMFHFKQIMIIIIKLQTSQERY